MNSFLFKILSLLLIFNVLGCSDQPSKKSSTAYFDLKSYMDQEIQKVSTSYTGSKAVSINNKKESMSVNSKSLVQDLMVFKNSDINKPSWRGMYQVDSSFNAEKQLLKVAYKALKPTLKTQLLALSFQNDQIVKLEITNLTKARIADANQTLIYEPGKGYFVENRQKLMLFPESVITIKTDFVKK